MALIHQYGGIGVFFGLVLEFIGLPLPGEALTSFLGYVSFRVGGYSVYINIIYATLGSLLGSIIAYFIGGKYGEKVLIKYGKFIHITQENLDFAKKLFNKNKILLMLFGRYIPGVRVLVSYLGGISRLDFGTFFLYTSIGTFVWCSTFIGLGFILGEKWTVVETIIRTYFLVFLIIVAFVYIVFKFFNGHKKAIFAISLPMFLFVKLSEDLIKKELETFDSIIYDYISKAITHNMTGFMKLMSYLGSGYVLVFISIVSIILFWKSKKYSFYSKMVGVNLIASSIANEIFKMTFHRGRPNVLRLIEISGFSFPSGHSMIGLSFYGFISYLCFKNIKSKWRYAIVTLFGVLILSIGISRIYLGVHFASDVVAGFSAGLAWLAAFITIVKMSKG